MNGFNLKLAVFHPRRCTLNMRASAAFALLALLASYAACAQPPITGFAPPTNGTATGGDLGDAFAVDGAADCAAACVANSSCIAFTLLPPLVMKTCGIIGECYAPNASSCPATLSLACPGGVFTAVTFAQFGLPLCGSGECAFSANPACAAPTSADVVARACVGKERCSIPVQASTFGPDPCQGHYKFLAASLAGTGCGSAPPGGPQCQLSQYSRTFALLAGGDADGTYYQKLQPRDDTPFGAQAVPFALDVPTGGVTLRGGPLGAAFDTGIEYLLGYSVDDLLFQFRKRAGLPQPPGAACIGWDCRADWIEGSLAGLFLMGAGGHLRWVEHPQLRSMMDQLIDGIENCTEADGWLSAYTQEKMATDEHPDYTTSWTVHGFLEAHIAGNPKALRMIRAHMNVFNNHSLIPSFLPPDGGNWPWAVPAGPFPPGINNKTSYTGSTLTGHTIYLIVQGLIHSTRMALSPVGTRADVALLENLYIEPWWLEALAARDVTVISHKLYDAHNYQLTGIEAYLDLYVLTGKQLYLDAVMGAWQLHRDPLHGFIHVGGSVAINEGGVYEPGSYWLTGRYPISNKRRDAMREARGRAAGEPSALAAPHAHDHEHGHENGAHAHGEHAHEHDAHGRELQHDWGQHPTGEFCGAVFWLKINQRLHRLTPDNETFVLEMEREVYNEGLGHQGKNGEGIRYFSNMDGVKENAQHIGTCCEGQGTRLYGSLNEYLFSTVAGGAGIYVDIYAPSSIVHGALNLTVDTAWPYGSAVSITVSSSAPGGAAVDVALRMPSWLAAASVPVSLNGAPAAFVGTPGSYLHVLRSWGAGDVLAFDLAMALTPHPYTGVTQIAGRARFSYTFGPVLLASTGAYDAALGTENYVGIDGASPAAWMVPVAGSPLHWSVAGVAGALFQPAWEVDQGRNFSAVPAFDA